jgi:spore maturation protein CgeB
MHFVVFGLSVSSSWGNGHATLWRSLLKELSRRRHTVSFYERDVPYYASTRDGWQCPDGIQLHIYESLDKIRRSAMRECSSADIALCTSYCPDGATVARMICESNARIKAFYDLDTPVTLKALKSGSAVEYLPAEGLGLFDFVLSYTGGKALDELQSRLGAQLAIPLYGSVDPETHRPAKAIDGFRATLTYLGTYAEDRQKALEELFLKPASRKPQERFVLGGALYPEDFPWRENLYFVRHLPPSLHPAFFCSGRATLNITRGCMAEYGYCPSGRLFEAAACGTAILSDWWEGLEAFFSPGEEILRVQSADDVCNALALSDAELRNIGEAARQRALEQHSAARRVRELEEICERVVASTKLATTA